MDSVTPAEGFVLREEERSRPPTPKQLEVLEFFLGSNHGILRFGECHDKISELFTDEEEHNL
jgi:hypothetical protein